MRGRDKDRDRENVSVRNKDRNNVSDEYRERAECDYVTKVYSKSK